MRDHRQDHDEADEVEGMVGLWDSRGQDDQAVDDRGEALRPEPHEGDLLVAI